MLEAIVIAEIVKTILDISSYAKKGVDLKRFLEEKIGPLLSKLEIREKDIIINGLTEFWKGNLIDENIVEKIKYMSKEEWKSYYEKIINVLNNEHKDDLNKAILARYTTLALLNDEINHDDYSTIMQILEKVDSASILALAQQGILSPIFATAASPYFETLMPYGLLVKTYEENGRGILEPRYNFSPIGNKIYKIAWNMKENEPQVEILNDFQTI